MSQTQNTKQIKNIDEYECSGTGPRPPVPGEESKFQKMIEPETSSRSTTAPAQNSSPKDVNAECNRILNWQKNLANLLLDEEGVRLFQQYINGEARSDNIHKIHLDFYFACVGLKQQTDESIIRQIIGAIYRKFLRKEIPVSLELRNTIKKIVKNELPPNSNIYDELQNEIELKISQTTYPNFLRSDEYLQCVQKVQNDGGIGSESCSKTSSSDLSANYSVVQLSSGSKMYINKEDSLDLNTNAIPSTSSILLTLHEDKELMLNDDSSTKSMSSSKPKLTKDLLLATQARRLDVRPAGAHGYNVTFLSSFNPVSRQCSSASKTDSETKSLVSSKDGQPYSHRKQHSSEKFKNIHVNPKVEANESIVRPVTQARIDTARQNFNQKLFSEKVKAKLDKLKEEQDSNERFQRAITEIQNPPKASTSNTSRSAQQQSQAHQKAVTAAILKKLSQFNDDNDQAILDLHVSRVFSPHLSPGTISPCQAAAKPHRRSHEAQTGATQSMRNLKSIPESTAAPTALTSRKPAIKCPSVTYDSGISSMYSADPPYIPRETRSINREETPPVDTRRMLDDESHRGRRNVQPQPSGHQTLPRIREQSDEYTFAVYTFCDEPLGYRVKIPDRNPTLKQFKELLPKKGNFRYFFRTTCDDLKCVINEEMVNDSDVLPIFDGKIMGTVKPE